MFKLNYISSFIALALLGMSGQAFAEYAGPRFVDSRQVHIEISGVGFANDQDIKIFYASDKEPMFEVTYRSALSGNEFIAVSRKTLKYAQDRGLNLWIGFDGKMIPQFRNSDAGLM